MDDTSQAAFAAAFTSGLESRILTGYHHCPAVASGKDQPEAKEQYYVHSNHRTTSLLAESLHCDKFMYVRRLWAGGGTTVIAPQPPFQSEFLCKWKL